MVPFNWAADCFTIRAIGLPATANGPQGKTWHTKWAKNKDVRDQIMLQALSIHNSTGITWQRAHVVVELIRSHGSTRPFDYENMTIMGKGAIDGLRFGKLIHDDDEEHLQREYRQRRAKQGEQPGILLTISPWKEAR